MGVAGLRTAMLGPLRTSSHASTWALCGLPRGGGPTAVTPGAAAAAASPPLYPAGAVVGTGGRLGAAAARGSS